MTFYLVLHKLLMQHFVVTIYISNKVRITDHIVFRRWAMLTSYQNSKKRRNAFTQYLNNSLKNVAPYSPFMILWIAFYNCTPNTHNWITTRTVNLEYNQALSVYNKCLSKVTNTKQLRVLLVRIQRLMYASLSTSHQTLWTYKMSNEKSSLKLIWLSWLHWGSSVKYCD